MSVDKFPPPRPDSKPTIYAYEDTNPQYRGLLKIGYTTVDAQTRVAQQYPTLKPGKPPYRILLEVSAMRMMALPLPITMFTGICDRPVSRIPKASGSSVRLPMSRRRSSRSRPAK